MSGGLTAALGSLIAEARGVALPSAAIAVAKQGWVDCVGTMLAGANEEATLSVRAGLEADGFGGPATVHFSGRCAAPMFAAWINGTAAHALDYDDVALKGSHPSAVLVPAILAEAQALGSSGAEMLRAYVVGYEVWGELIYRERGNHQRKGWHPTGVFGALGAAAACASLRGLDATRAAHALGIAASEASGVVANLGFSVKPMHAGKAAACGLLAARFAERGLTASPQALENDQGLLAALSPAGDVDRESGIRAARDGWRIVDEGLAIKQYPVCYRAHRAIDAMLGLVRGHSLDPDAVRSMVVRFSRSHAVILKNHRPRTPIEAKFSIEFALACALSRGGVGLADLAPDVVRDPRIQSLIERVSIEINPEEMPGTSGYAPYDTVSLELADGRRLESEQVRHARGDPEAPLDMGALWTKFEDCAAWSGLGIDARALFDRLQALERCEHADELADAARGKAAGKGIGEAIRPLPEDEVLATTPRR